jgi:branched-chain amino acid transport system permease protein
MGSGLAAAAGALLGSIFLIYPAMGNMAILKAFIVVILGGMGNFLGAIFGGLILGVTEGLGAGFVSSGYKDAIGFVLVILILMFKPSGLLGKGRRL